MTGFKNAFQQLYHYVTPARRTEDIRRLYSLAFIPDAPFFHQCITASKGLAVSFREGGHSVRYELSGELLKNAEESDITFLDSSSDSIGMTRRILSFPHMTLVHFWANEQEAVAAEQSFNQKKVELDISEVKVRGLSYLKDQPQLLCCNHSDHISDIPKDGFTAWVYVNRTDELKYKQSEFCRLMQNCVGLKNVITESYDAWDPHFTLLIVEKNGYIGDVSPRLHVDTLPATGKTKGRVVLGLSRSDGQLSCAFLNEQAVRGVFESKLLALQPM